jgi:hypothetical protein
MLCGASKPRAAQLTAALAPEWATVVEALPPASSRTAAATAASARLAHRLDGVEALIIWPTLAARRGARNPGAGAWRDAIDAQLRGAYLIGRAGGLAFAAGAGGRLLVVIDAPAKDDAIAAVVAEGLDCLADGLRKALDARVDVAQLRLAPGLSDRAVAQQVRAWLAAPAAAATVTVRRATVTGARARRSAPRG